MRSQRVESLLVVCLMVLSFIVFFESDNARAGGLRDDGFKAIAQDASYIYTAGYTTSFGAGGGEDVIVQKYSKSNGQLIWTYLWNGAGGPISQECAYSIALQDGNPGWIYITGRTNGFSPDQNDDVFVLKLSKSGGIDNQFGNGGGFVIWGSLYNDVGYGITVTQEPVPVIYVTGTTWGCSHPGGQPSVFILRYDQLGNNLWGNLDQNRAVIWDPFMKEDYGYSIACDYNNGDDEGDDRIYVTGYTDPAGNGLYDCFLLCYDDTGQPVTIGHFINGYLLFGSESFDYAYSLFYDLVNSEIYVVGYGSIGVYGMDLLFFRCDYMGFDQYQLRWFHWPMEPDYCGKSILYDGNYIWITGTATSAVIAEDLFIAQCDRDGFPNNGWPVRYDFGYIFAYGKGIVVDSNNVYVTGELYGHWDLAGVAYFDTMVGKFRKDNGAIEDGWPIVWSNTFSDYTMAIEVTDNAVYVAGYTYGYGTIGECDAFVAKYSLDGWMLWWRTWGSPGSNDRAYAIAVTDSAVFIAGSTETDNPNDIYDFFIMKYDLNGNPQSFAGVSNGYVSSINQNDEIFGMDIQNGLLYCTGYWQVNTKDILLVDSDFNGNEINTHLSRFATPPDANEEAYSIVVDGYHAYCAGYTFSRNAPNGGNGDALLVIYELDLQNNKKFKANTLITRLSDYLLFGGQLFDCGYSVAIDDEYIYWSGSIRSTQQIFPPPIYDNSFLQKCSKIDRNIEWTDLNEDTWNDIAYSVEVNGNYIYVAGYEEKYGSGLQDVYVRKYDLSGNPAWQTFQDDPAHSGMVIWGGSNVDIGRGIGVSDDIFTVGWTDSYGPISFNGLVLRHSLDGEACYYKLWS